MNEASVTGLEEFLDRNVVVDVDSLVVYIGKLTELNASVLTMTDVDVHDLHDSRTTKEMYAMETKKYGIRVNRKKVLIRLSEVISVSALDDIVDF